MIRRLYVTRARRREGIGRALLQAVEAHGRELGAPRVWLETTSVNVPGTAAYVRLGYALCGVDTILYDTRPYADEAAVYLAKLLRSEAATRSTARVPSVGDRTR